MTRVLLVDDHALFRKGVRALLATVPGLSVVAEAADGREAVRRCREAQPDLVLLDLQMPGGDGLSAIPELLAARPDVAILVVTMRADDAAVHEALRAGARGYVLKDMDGDDFIRAVSSVTQGAAFLGPEVAPALLSLATRSERAPFPELTERERGVLTLMARGRSNAQISAEMFLSQKTVQNYVSRVLAKLQVADRPQAIVAAREAGLHLD